MIHTLNSCPLCKSAVPKSTWDDNRVFQIECKVCGTYRIGGIAVNDFADSGPYPDLSGVVRNQHEDGQSVLVTRDNWEDLKSRAPDAKDVPAKIHYLLRYMARRSQQPGDAVEFHRDTDYPLCLAANAREMAYYFSHAKQANYIADAGTTMHSDRYCLTPEGWEEVTRTSTVRPAGPTTGKMDKHEEILATTKAILEEVRDQPAGVQIFQQTVTGNGNIFSGTGRVRVRQMDVGTNSDEHLPQAHGTKPSQTAAAKPANRPPQSAGPASPKPCPMSRLSNLQVPPPRYWQEFEDLCLDLWRRIWDDPNAQKNGRPGQVQHGVDVLGQAKNGHWAGVNCKWKDANCNARLAVVELREEVERAKEFQPKLSQLILATTAKRDAKIQSVARQLSQEHAAAGLFSVTVWSWDDILECLDNFPELAAKYYSSIHQITAAHGGNRPQHVFRPVSFGLHGIRTHAGWSRAFSEVAAVHGHIVSMDRWNFGYFSAFQFLMPWARAAKVRWFRSAYREEMQDKSLGLDGDHLPSIVAHSFGTYILGNALLKYDWLRFDKVILCGSILPVDFPWDKLIERGQIQAVKNEYGVKDIWSGLVRWFVAGTGPSGLNGFRCSHGRLDQERFEYTHSEYFDKGHMEAKWLPLLNRQFPPIASTTISVERRKASWPWGLYVVYLVLLVLLAVTTVLVQRNIDRGNKSATIKAAVS